MATTFSFRLHEKDLQFVLTEMTRRREADPSKTEQQLEVSVDLIPDGVGYEAFNLQTHIVSEALPDVSTSVAEQPA
jgi:hypothetical protein